MVILVDAMGGDNAPLEIVKGCVEAVKEREGFDITLIGNQQEIEKILKAENFSSPRINIVHASEVISNEDSPTKAIRSKKDSSMVVGFNLLKQKKGDVFVSAGLTGALLVGALLTLGRIKGVDRPALAPVLPTRRGAMLLLDAGANTLCKPVNYLQFGIMGSIYMRDVLGIENPRVGLLNVGTEEQKGSDTIKHAYNLLAKSNINFVGNVEGQEMPDGKVDVAVSDGFVGNVALKVYEGVAMYLMGELKTVFYENIITKLSALLINRGLKKLKKKADPSEYGGVPFLGVNGKVVKAHGRSKAKAIKNAVFKAINYAKSPIIDQIYEEFKNMEVEELE